jgi:hypothetical protein
VTPSNPVALDPCGFAALEPDPEGKLDERETSVV